MFVPHPSSSHDLRHSSKLLGGGGQRSSVKEGIQQEDGIKRAKIIEATPLSNKEGGAAGEGLAAEPQTGEGNENGLAALMAGAKIGC